MADPARYDVFAVLRTRQTQNNGEYPVAELEDERHEGGAWIKWADFKDDKAARRRNSTEDAVTSLGVEVAQLRAENERLRKASFVTSVPAEQYERVIKAGDAMASVLEWNTDSGTDADALVKAWLAAKKGRDAK